MSTREESRVIERYSKMPTEEKAISYGKALKVIIGADGDLAEAELKALFKGLKKLGASPSMVKQLEDFSVEGVSLESVLPKLTPGGKKARFLLRDAIQLCRADGTYAAEEKKAVARAAELLGVDQGTLRSLEALVELEDGVRHLRKALLPTR